MSTFTNRLNSMGEFSIGQAKFAILEIKASWIRCVQTHKSTNGSPLDKLSMSFDGNGIFNVSNAYTSCPVGFWVPQTHTAFNNKKAEIADLDNRKLELCPTCVGNEVDPTDMVGACDSCINNLATINYLKSLMV